jgi:oxalate decarboxylase/phosphoglucose isomerase-like protein (cupin superfamily)
VSGVLRADTTPRAAGEGPFGHLDIRWIVDRETAGSTLVAFGQTTYPGGAPGEGATHETHYHPNAEEVVLVTSGLAHQVIGDETLRMGPGDVCFIPKGVPHRIEAAADDDLVILWVLAGAASLEDAGYVPVDA